jgi:hypothetical protein
MLSIPIFDQTLPKMFTNQSGIFFGDLYFRPFDHNSQVYCPELPAMLFYHERTGTRQDLRRQAESAVYTSHKALISLS